MELKEKKESKGKYNKYIVVILIGLLLLIIIMPVSDNKEKSIAYQEKAVSDSYSYSAQYYENRLKSILEKSYGEGSMDVMVHLKESSSGDSFYGEESKMEVDGVLIVAAVKDRQAVSDISFAVCALFNLPAHKVAVIVK